MLPKFRISTHPGELILKEFMYPLGMSVNDLHAKCRCSLGHLVDVLVNKGDVTDEDAEDFAKVFGTSVQMWKNAQEHYELTKDNTKEMTLDISIEYKWIQASDTASRKAPPEYYYLITPKATLTVMDSTNSSDIVKAYKFWKAWRISVETNYEVAQGESFSIEKENIEGTTLEEVKAEALEYLYNFIEEEQSIYTGVLEELKRVL